MKYTIILCLLLCLSVSITNAQIEKTLDENFIGFEKRSIQKNESKILVYTSPPSSVYQEGAMGISGIKLLVNNNAIASVSPVVKKTQPPSLEIIYSKVRKGTSLSDILTEISYDNLDSSQIYFTIFSWCQAAVIFRQGDINLNLTIDQKNHLRKECGIPEVANLINYEKKENSGDGAILKLLMNILENPI